MSINIDYSSLFRSTLDVDTNDKETIKRITQKILKCPNIFHIHKKPSSHKGYHFILRCYIKCDICRLCYDDFRRYNYDVNRPEWARNILFDREEDYKQQKKNEKLPNCCNGCNGACEVNGVPYPKEACEKYKKGIKIGEK